MYIPGSFLTPISGDTQLPSWDLWTSLATAWRDPGGSALLPLAAAPLHHSGLAPCPAPPQPGRPGRGRGRGSGGVSGTEAVGAPGSGARWRRECCSREEACCGQPPTAASCPGSGEQRRPFRGPAGEGPPWGEGRGVPGAGRRRRGAGLQVPSDRGLAWLQRLPGSPQVGLKVTVLPAPPLLGTPGLAGRGRPQPLRAAPPSVAIDASPQVGKRSGRMAGPPLGKLHP